MEILALPPQPGPKQLSARFKPTTLHDHFMAFLNANNRNGFVGEDGSGPDIVTRETVSCIPQKTIGDLLLFASSQDVMGEKFFKRMAKLLTRAEGKNQLSHAVFLQILSKLFGYESYEEARKHFARADKLPNLRKQEAQDLRQLIFRSAALHENDDQEEEEGSAESPSC